MKIKTNQNLNQRNLIKNQKWQQKDKDNPKSDKKHKEILGSDKKKQKSGDKSEGDDKNTKLETKNEVSKWEPELQPCKKEDCPLKKWPMGASYEAAEVIKRKHIIFEETWHGCWK